MPVQTNLYHTSEEVATNFAAWLYEWLHGQDNVNIALSGGSTPKLLFKTLASEYPHKIDWEKINFFWGDERCVPPDHDDSNYKMTKQLLLDPLGIPVNQIHRIIGENPPQQEAERYGEEIRQHLIYQTGWPVFDLVILGMGPDGHTASIFPSQLGLMESKKICEVGTHPGSGQKRVTITGKVINNAHQVAVLATGASKAEKIQEIFNRQGNWQQYPAAHIAPVHGQLIWYLDMAAMHGEK